MEDQDLTKPEAVWLLEDEDMVTEMKEEPESECISDGENEYASLESVEQEFFENPAEVEQEGSLSPGWLERNGEEIKSEIDVEEHSIEEDTSVSTLPCQESGNVNEQNTTMKIKEELGTKRSLKCDLCHKCYTDPSGLTVHMRTHTGEKPFKCDVCSKSFTYYNSHVVHMISHTREKAFKCKMCNKCFKQPSSLKMHMRTHTGEKLIKCEVCHKCFTHPQKFTVHMRTHTGEKPFKCEICKKCFTETGTLSVHMRIHTGEKPFKCEVCSKCFTYGNSLRAHMKTHGEKKPLKCEICNECFTRPRSLKVHMRSHSAEKLGGVVVKKIVPRCLYQMPRGQEKNVGPVPHNKGAKIRQWDPESMAKAISAIRNHEMGWLKASKTFQVPQKTLRRLADKKYGTPEEASTCKHGRPHVFNDELEQELVRYCLTMESTFHGLTRKDLRGMALQLATKNNIKHPFNDVMAGKSWLRIFLKRHPELSIRKPTGVIFQCEK